MSCNRGDLHRALVYAYVRNGYTVSRFELTLQDNSMTSSSVLLDSRKSSREWFWALFPAGVVVILGLFVYLLLIRPVSQAQEQWDGSRIDQFELVSVNDKEVSVRSVELPDSPAITLQLTNVAGKLRMWEGARVEAALDPKGALSLCWTTAKTCYDVAHSEPLRKLLAVKLTNHEVVAAQHYPE